MKNLTEYINESIDVRESNTDKIPVKARNIGKKLLDNLYGGDFNGLSYAMDQKDFKSFRQYCNAINYNYSKPVFRSDDIKYMIDNWDLCVKAYQNYYDEK
jgi:hypothetical protein